MVNSKTKLIQGYQAEIAYQKHMLENIGRWLSLSFGVTMIGLVVLYFYSSNLFLAILFGLLTLAGALLSILFGYVIYRGRRNLQRVLADFDQKLNQQTS